MADNEENRIKQARIEAGLSIKELAELLGAPYRTVQNWNLGERKPPEWLERLIVKEIYSHRKSD